MQEWVEGPRTNAIPMMLQLVHHGQSKDWLMGRMHQHMNPNESEEEFPLLFQHNVNIPSRGDVEFHIIEFRYMLFESVIRFLEAS